jgi:hypothetical protein
MAACTPERDNSGGAASLGILTPSQNAGTAAGGISFGTPPTGAVLPEPS